MRMALDNHLPCINLSTSGSFTRRSVDKERGPAFEPSRPARATSPGRTAVAIARMRRRAASPMRAGGRASIAATRLSRDVQANKAAAKKLSSDMVFGDD